MLIRTLFVFLGFICSVSSWAFPCYLTIAKDSCWTKYNVSVDIIDAVTEKKIITITIPSGTSWSRETFECTAAQSLIYIAQFSPVFWESDKGKRYRAVRNWALPGVIHPNDRAWTIPVCYPADFSQVPLPPQADSKCKCDFTVIPKIKLQ
jgi:hypothetical protein